MWLVGTLACDGFTGGRRAAKASDYARHQPDTPIRLDGRRAGKVVHLEQAASELLVVARFEAVVEDVIGWFISPLVSPSEAGVVLRSVVLATAGQFPAWLLEDALEPSDEVPASMVRALAASQIRPPGILQVVPASRPAAAGVSTAFQGLGTLFPGATRRRVGGRPAHRWAESVPPQLNGDW